MVEETKDRNPKTGIIKNKALKMVSVKVKEEKRSVEYKWRKLTLKVDNIITGRREIEYCKNEFIGGRRRVEH